MSVNTKYTVFISSTYEDLKEERQEIVKACLKKGHIPIGMEMFSAGNESQWEVIQRTIEASDYYVLILAHRYGSTIDAEGGISYTEKEYDYAVKVGVPVIGLVISKEAGWPDTKRETDRVKLDRLAAFKAKVQSRMIAFWTDKASLRIEFGDGFDAAQISHARPGWIRSNQAASPQIANEIARLSEDNERLRKELAAVGDEEAQLVRELRTESQMKLIPCESCPRPCSLWDWFLEWAHAFRSLNRLGLSSGASSTPGGDDFARDCNRVMAFDLIEQDILEPTYPHVKAYRLTPLGRSIINRLDRARMLGHTGTKVT